MISWYCVICNRLKRVDSQYRLIELHLLESVKPLRIAVIANCQARPMAGIIRLLAPNIEISGITITHLAKPDEAQKAFELYSSSDYIFAQWVSDSYPVEFLRATAIKEKFKDKVISWPNIFFRGQCPDLFYVTHPEKGRIVGPLWQYQNRVIYDGWRKGLAVSEVIKLMTEGGDWLIQLEEEAIGSLTALQQRETNLNVIVSDEIVEHWHTQQLFFTFNHPVKYLLQVVARRLLQTIACRITETPVLNRRPEPFLRIIPTLMPVVVNQLNLNIPARAIAKGCNLTISDKVQTGNETVYYEPYALIETSFRALDKQLAPDDIVKFS